MGEFGRRLGGRGLFSGPCLRRANLIERTFFDTNVLLYADDLSAGLKTTRARACIDEAVSSSRAVVSTQVLREYFAVATRKLRLDPANARQRVEIDGALDTVLVGKDLILSAIDLHRRHSRSVRDALLVRAALQAGRARLVSEVRQHGRVFGGVRIENPLLPKP